MNAAFAPALIKVTVNLTEANYAALLAAANREGDSKTVTINRALGLYDFLTRELGEGWQLQFRRGNHVQEVTLR